MRLGISKLLHEASPWVKGRRIGLVAHHASRDENGVHSAQLLQESGICTLMSIFSPEHGFDGQAGAGDTVDSFLHEELGVPILSLYGATREPTDDMLEDIDTIIFDLQDLAVRCYTYGSTLRLILNAATRTNKRVIVADRPAVLPNTIDGPTLDTALSSFVGLIPTPLAYGLTSGELARFLGAMLRLDLDLCFVPMDGNGREHDWQAGLPWIPPSPGIPTPTTAMTYPATVWCESLPVFDYGRGTDHVFQVVGTPGVQGNEVCDELEGLKLPGVSFQPHTWLAEAGKHKGHTITGVHLRITDTSTYLPVQTGLAILIAMQSRLGLDALWGYKGTGLSFFDQLMGTGEIRQAVQSGASAAAIAETWQISLKAFAEMRKECLLYPEWD